MISESARASSAGEARFRISDPNSARRLVKVVALDGPSAALIKGLAQHQWDGASFLIATTPDMATTPDPLAHPHANSATEKLTDITGQRKDLANEIGSADLVVMIAMAGESAANASAIGAACRRSGVTLSGLVLAKTSTPDAVLSETLAQLRAWTQMLVVASAADYVADMLTALRA
jgi:hypothetical protein